VITTALFSFTLQGWDGVGEAASVHTASDDGASSDRSVSALAVASCTGLCRLPW